MRRMGIGLTCGCAAVVLAGLLPASDERARSSGGVTIDRIVLTLVESAEIAARDSGVLQKIEAKEGSAVDAGDLLATLDDDEPRLALARATTELERVRTLAENDLVLQAAVKSRDVAAADLKRSLDSVERYPKSVSATELDRLRLLAEKAELDVEQARVDLRLHAMDVVLKGQDLEAAELTLEKRRLLAPFPGTVVEWRKHRGEWVEKGTPVARLVRLDRVRAEGFAPASLRTKLRPGTRVRFVATDAPESQSTTEGEVVYVSPEIDPINQQMRFYAELPNDERLLHPGQIGKLELELSR